MKRGSIFELDGVPRLREAAPLALQHVVAMICGRRWIKTRGSGYSDSGVSGDVCHCHTASAVSYRKKIRFCHWLRPSYDHGCQLCLCAQYAGNCRRLWCGCYFWRPDRGRYRSSCNGTSGPADKGVLSASDHRNCCIYDRSFSLSHCY